MKHVLTLEWTDLKITIEGRAKAEINTVKADAILIASKVIEQTQELDYGKPRIKTRDHK